MEFVIKKTTDLADSEISRICLLFEEVFVGHSKNLLDFKNEFLNTALGYSYHALLFDKEEIVGAHSLIPCHYKMGEKAILTAFSVDTMIRRGYRDFFNLKDLVELTEMEAKKAGIHFIFGFPNDNSYPVLKKGLKYSDIGKMSTYIYPYRIGGIKSGLHFLNFLSIIFCRFMEFISVLVSNKTINTFLVDKDRTLYDSYRYKWFNNSYKQITLDNFRFVYRIVLHEGIRTVFLLDMDNVSSHNILRAVSYIRKKNGKEFDLLMYVGWLPCKHLPLIKLPRKLEPKNFNFTGKFLDKENIDDRFFNIENWNVNLSCYDLI